MKPKAYSSAMDSNNDWQARSDMQTLLDARKIKADPKRLKAALACAQKQKEMLETVTEYAPDTASED